jgi:Tfp pilus assembly protein PilX
MADNIRNDRGMALITSLLLSLGIMIMVMGVLYFITQSTTMSGAGKRYATAAEAADGAIEVAKDTINLTMWGEPVAGVFPSSNCLATAILNQGDQGTCASSSFSLPGVSGTYTATVRILRLYSVALPGNRIEFARGGGAVSGTAIYYRITSSVTGPGNTKAESSVLYRFVG